LRGKKKNFQISEAGRNESQEFDGPLPQIVIFVKTKLRFFIGD